MLHLLTVTYTVMSHLLREHSVILHAHSNINFNVMLAHRNIHCNVTLAHSNKLTEIMLAVTEWACVKINCWCSKTVTVLLKWTVPKIFDVCLMFLLHHKQINTLYGNVCILYINVCILYINVCILYINVHIKYTLYSSLMSTSGTVIQYTGWGCQPPNPTNSTV
jgi:hypothetical protein